MGALSAVAPAPAIVSANASTSATSTVAGQVAAAGTTSVITTGVPVTTTAPTKRAAPAAASKAATKLGALAPFRFGTVNYNKWWAKKLLATQYHITSQAQFTCLVTVWNRESHWNHKAHNRSSGAHGIPQALPGSKMRTAGADWRTNPVTQIRCGLGYIDRRYGSPCGALHHMNSHGWY